MLGRLPILLLVVLSSPAPAAADWLVTPWIGVKFAGETTLLDLEDAAGKKKFAWGAAAGFLTDGVLGAEVDFSYIPAYFEGESRLTSGPGEPPRAGPPLVARSRALTLTGNILVAAPLAVVRDGLRPYFIGGVGLIHGRSEQLVGFTLLNTHLLGFNLGAGALGPVTPRTSLRFEVRHFRNIGGDADAPVLNVVASTHLSFWRATAGITLRY